MIGLPRSLRGRLLASAALFTVLALLATGLAVNLALHRFVQGQVDQRLDGQLLTIEAALAPGPGNSVILSHNVDGPPFDDPKSGWQWLAKTPTRTWHSAGAASFDVVAPPPARGRHPESFEGAGSGERPLRIRSRIVEIGGQSISLAAAAPLDAISAPMREAMRLIGTALAVLGVGLLSATLLQVRIGLRPLAELQAALTMVRTGRADRLPANQPAEIGPLVVEMNSLLDQNAANLERARRHVANLAHALKTPLAALAVALDEPARAADRHLIELVVAMDRRIRHHLARARAAALGSPARHTLVLATRVADHAAAFTKIHADKAVDCEVRIPSGVTVACDPQDLDEIVGNVLDNAFKWARSRVRVAANSDCKSVRIVIEDDGPGIPAGELAEVLRPGRRLDEAMPGDGFGLAIVQELAELYGGGLALSAAGLGGLSVTLMLPAGLGSAETGTAAAARLLAP